MKAFASTLTVAATLTLFSPAHAGPAPKLTYLQVAAVMSTAYPVWDYTNDNQLITTQNHTGPELLVATREYGYGQSTIAKVNGYNMTQLRQEPILSGNTVIGYVRYWYYNGNFTSGQFTYQATSINYPYNIMSDWINIK